LFWKYCESGVECVLDGETYDCPLLITDCHCITFTNTTGEGLNFSFRNCFNNLNLGFIFAGQTLVYCGKNPIAADGVEIVENLTAPCEEVMQWYGPDYSCPFTTTTTSTTSTTTSTTTTTTIEPTTTTTTSTTSTTTSTTTTTTVEPTTTTTTTVCDCPPGFTVLPDESGCVAVNETPPSIVDTLLTADITPNDAYGNGGFRIYNINDYDILGNSISTTYAFQGLTAAFGGPTPEPANTAFWRQRLNTTGVWVSGNAFWPDPAYPDYVSLCDTVELTESKIYYIGIAGDNDVTIKLNGTIIVDQYGIGSSAAGTNINFNYWHIYPVQIPAGTNVIELEGWNRTQVGGFAAEIYDNTLSELIAATSTAMINIVFTTENYRSTGPLYNSNFCSNFGCPGGYSYDIDSGTCVERIDVNCGEPAPTTTTSTTSTTTSTTSTTTTTTVCQRPTGLTDGILVSQVQNAGDPIWNFRTVSVVDACNAFNYYHVGTGGSYGFTQIEINSLTIGERVYPGWSLTSCTNISAGYYIYQPNTAINVDVYLRDPATTSVQIVTVSLVGGFSVITAIDTCLYTTTTTTI